MNLTEHQSKKLLREAGIRVPPGYVATSAEEAVALLQQIGEPPWVVKAQIAAGGRGAGYFLDDPAARGGVRFVETVGELRSNALQMLGGTLVTRQTGLRGDRVGSVYVEEQCRVENEMYLALTIDRELGGVAFIAGRDGGSEVESQALIGESSVRVFGVEITSEAEPLLLPGAVIADVTAYLGLQGACADELGAIMKSLFDLFVERDAALIEINPFGVAADGSLVALDAAIVWDDNALFRQGHEEQLVAYDGLPVAEYEALVHGLNFVSLDGNIGTLAAGAGLAMATLDAIKECGGEPANFMDIPPSAAVEKIKAAITILLQEDSIDVIVINVFGGGIMRCDAICDALLLANNEAAIKKPLVVRLAGTNSELALQRLRSSLPQVHAVADLAEAAQKGVALALDVRGEKQRPDSVAGWLKKARSLLPERST